jgi:hypothetical protein
MLVLLGSVSCRDGNPARMPEIQTIGPPLLAQEIRLSRPISSEPDTMGFAIATGVAFLGRRLAVL